LHPLESAAFSRRTPKPAICMRGSELAGPTPWRPAATPWDIGRAETFFEPQAFDVQT
jgi:hypothetical protein